MKFMVFTDSDLDGVVSYLVFRWFFKDHQIDVKPTTISKFRNDYSKWLSRNNINDYDKIYVLDLDVHECIDLIDNDKHTIIDHHKTHVDNLNYKNATTIVKEYTSCCKLLYKIFKQLYNQDPLSFEQKKLLLMADDYDCYKLELPDTRYLNVIYWNTQNRFDSFVKNFYNGFTGFTYQQQNIIKLYNQEIKEMLDNLEVYGIKTSVQGKEVLILSTFTTKYINEIADVLLDKGACIAIIVNTSSNHVSFRRSTTCDDINLIEFTNKVTGGSGGGHEYASGSEITDTFIDFTKCLKEWKNE